MERERIGIHERDRIILSLHKIGLGLEIIGNNVGLTHQGVKYVLKHKLGYYEPIREWDTEYIKRDIGINSHIPKELIDHTLDFSGINDTSIRRGHHARKIIANILLGTIRNIKTGRIIWKIWKEKPKNPNRKHQRPRETKLKTLQLIQKALDQGEKIRYLRFDKEISKSTVEKLKKMGITAVVYPKNQDEPFNTLAEQTFSNIHKIIHLWNKEIENMTDEEAYSFIKALCYAVWDYNPKPLVEWYIMNKELVEQFRARVLKQLKRQRKNQPKAKAVLITTNLFINE